MDVLIGALVAILSIAFLLYPFVKWRFAHHTPLRPGSPGRDGLDNREAIYDDIRMLQLEYELGTIEKQEYHERLRAYRLQAAAALRDQARLQFEVERSLEEEILKVRDSGATVAGLAPCPSCGEPVPPGADVCQYCEAEPVSDTWQQPKGEGNDITPR